MLRQVISKRESELPPSSIGNLMKIAVERKDVISLGPGEPDFLPPKNVLSSVRKSITRATHYSPTEGIETLRKMIAKKLVKENKVKVDAEDVIVTSGSNEAILLALMCTVDPGEEVLIPDPGYMDYRPVVEILNGFPVPYKISEEDGFEINPDIIKSSITPGKTKVIIINTPGNPTGNVMERKTLEEVADIAVDNNILIISDEAYEKFIYGKSKHISIGSLNGMRNNVMTLQTFSKTYAMTGFRVGYAAGPRKIINAMKKMHIFASLCAPTISQFAAMEALKTKGYFIENARKEYERRGKFLYNRLLEMGISCTKPEGAFYLFPSIKNLGIDSEKFASVMLKKGKVAVLPGTEFGKYGEGHIRLSYATAYNKIAEATGRMEKVIKKMKI